MVYLEGGCGPTVKHEAHSSAVAEAERLAKLHKKRAYVLTAFKVVEPIVAVSVRWTEMSANK